MNKQKKFLLDGKPLKVLTPEQVRHIDKLLAALGEGDELHLIVQRGELRFLNKIESRTGNKNQSLSD